jgi:hypothetical protein
MPCTSVGTDNIGREEIEKDVNFTSLISASRTILYRLPQQGRAVSLPFYRPVPLSPRHPGRTVPRFTRACDPSGEVQRLEPQDHETWIGLLLPSFLEPLILDLPLSLTFHGD